MYKYLLISFFLRLDENQTKCTRILFISIISWTFSAIHYEIDNLSINCPVNQAKGLFNWVYSTATQSTGALTFSAALCDHTEHSADHMVTYAIIARNRYRCYGNNPGNGNKVTHGKGTLDSKMIIHVFTWEVWTVIVVCLWGICQPYATAIYHTILYEEFWILS